MKNILTAVCLLIFLLLQGCNTGPRDNAASSPPSGSYNSTGTSDLEEDLKAKPTTPTIGMLNYFSALQEGNVAEVKSCLSKDSLSGTSDDNLKQLAAQTQTKVNFRVHMETIKGNVSKVTYMYNDKNSEEILKDTLYLVLENGEWRVSLKTPNPNPFAKK